MSLNRSSAMDPNDLKIPTEIQRPWYMKGGLLVRNIQIFPDELPGEDRIPGIADLVVVWYFYF